MSSGCGHQVCDFSIAMALGGHTLLRGRMGPGARRKAEGEGGCRPELVAGRDCCWTRSPQEICHRNRIVKELRSGEARNRPDLPAGNGSDRVSTCPTSTWAMRRDLSREIFWARAGSSFVTGTGGGKERRICDNSGARANCFRVAIPRRRAIQADSDSRLARVLRGVFSQGSFSAFSVGSGARPESVDELRVALERRCLSSDRPKAGCLKSRLHGSSKRGGCPRRGRPIYCR